MRRTESRGLAQRTLAAMAWIFVGHGVQGLLQLLVLVVLARLLAPADFGLVGAALVVVGFSFAFSHLGAGPALVQRAVLEPRHVAAGFALSLLLGVVVAAVVVLAAPLAAALFGMPALVPILRAVSAVFLFQGAAVVAESLLQRALDFRALALVNAVAFVVGYAGVAVGMALAGYGAWALVGGVVAQAVVRAVAALLAQPHPVSLRLDREAVRDLFSFGAGFTLGRLGNYAATNGDSAVVAATLGAAALGFYGRALQLVSAPTTLFADVLDKALFPAMARVQDEPARLRLALRRGVALASLVSFPAAALLALLAPEIVLVVLGPAWDAAALPLRVLAVVMMVRTSSRVADALARATGAVYSRALRQWLYAALVLLGAWLGGRWGIAGAAAGVAAANVLHFLSMAHLGLRATGATWRAYGAAHLAALPLALVVAASGGLGATLARAAHGGPLLVLAAGVLAATLVTAPLLVARPAWLLGPDGRWMSDQLVQRARALAATTGRALGRARARGAEELPGGAK